MYTPSPQFCFSNFQLADLYNLYFCGMKTQIDTIRKIRIFMLAGIGELTIQELNKIPEGFNNNIIWNLGHLVASQQGLCYIRAGLPPVSGEDFILNYKTGTKPEKFIDAGELELIKNLLMTTLDQLESDYGKNIFTGYQSWSTRYGVVLASIDDALDFLPFHEGLHLGTINSLKRLVKK